MGRAREIELTQARYDGESRKKDRIVCEIPLTILVNGMELATMQCTPDKLEYLAVGFLLSEGLIKKETEIKGITLNEKGWHIRVEIAGDGLLEEGVRSKRVIGKGCAGGTSFYRAVDAEDCLPLISNVLISKEKIFSMMKKFLGMSDLYKDTGGVHSAALSIAEKIEIFAEDIGRHNAIDKILGECFLKGISTEDGIILTTGRVSSEILIKVAKQRIPVIVARSVPTDMAVGLAERLNITLIGSVKKSRMNIYTHDWRVKVDAIPKKG
ncbi:MAG: formate dehydrogenase accessory sulfurtransferase FdhD [Thermodesulfobacteriota bacterium]|nr:formate dehydrogenase accessory sulfurtransferase FdhD [Thermodesulfobacteriota bacterium]